MTHTHHRRGTSESLKKDFVILAMIDPNVKEQRMYKGNFKERVRRFLEICAKHDPVALLARSPKGRLRYMKGWNPIMNSGIHHASTLEEITNCEELADEGIGHAVYDNKEAVEYVLKELKEADLGFSIVISGIFDEVFDICRKVGLTPHTVNMSLGTWGKTQLLPKSQVLELCTMCGHAMISSKLADKMIELSKKGLKTPEEAAIELGKQCTCNIFNVTRAIEIIKKTEKPINELN
jgi:hypothetical protein